MSLPPGLETELNVKTVLGLAAQLTFPLNSIIFRLI